MSSRTAWAQLPAAARAAIERRAGGLSYVADVDGGLNCSAAARLRTTATGDLFVKAAECGSDGADHQDREATVAPWLPAPAPRVVAQAHAGGWHLLATVWINGRHAELGPRGRDLDAVARTLAATSQIRIPAHAPLPALVDRWDGYATPAEAELLTGDRLVHADVHPENILVRRGLAWLVDWAMSARGPAWIDTADTAVRLLDAGHTAADALAWAEQIPAWRDAPPAAVAAWADVSCRHWEACLGPRDARTGVARWRALRPVSV